MKNKIMGMSSDLSQQEINGTFQIDRRDYKKVKEEQLDSFWYRRKANARTFLLLGSIIKIFTYLDAFNFVEWTKGNLPASEYFHFATFVWAISHSTFCVILCILSIKRHDLLNYVLVNIIISQA
jgi:hypothetical protein